MLIDGPECMSAREVRGYFCGDKAATRLPGTPGRYRHQVNSTADARALGKLMADCMDREGLLGNNMELMATQQGLYGLRTSTAAVEAQGPYHTDWSRATCARFQPEEMPFSVIWAAAAAFELWVAQTGECVTIPRGKMVVFKGNWGHCGARHSTPCLRVHVFGRPVGSELKAPGNVWDWEA